MTAVLRNFIRVCATLLESTSAWMFAGVEADALFSITFLAQSDAPKVRTQHVARRLVDTCLQSAALHTCCAAVSRRARKRWPRQISPQSGFFTHSVRLFLLYLPLFSISSFASMCLHVSEQSYGKKRRTTIIFGNGGWLFCYCFAYIFFTSSAPLAHPIQLPHT